MNTDGNDTLKLTSKEKAPESKNFFVQEKFTHRDQTYVSAGYIDEPDADVEVQRHMYVFVVNRTTGVQIANHPCWIYNSEDAVPSRWTRVLAHVLWMGGKAFTVGEPDPAHPDEPTWIAGIARRWKYEDLPLRNRLWCKGEENRLFTNFPQKNNWIKYLTLNEVTLPPDTEFVVEITDSQSGTTYETLTFKPTEQRLQPEQWHEDFYNLIKSKGLRIKAGDWNAAAVLEFNSGSTAVWIPRNSELELVVSSSGTVVTPGKSTPAKPPESTAPAFVLSLAGSLIKVPETGLPDMTGFENDELGVPENSWLSPSYLLADRDLEVGEVLNAWLIRLDDGEPLEHVIFTAETNNRLKTQWPQAFAKSINEQAKQIRAGGWNDEGDFTDLSRSASPEEFASLDIVGKSELNRLWHYSRNNRAFSTAAYRNNWAQTLTLSDAALTADTTLWAQVRDITSQYLYETHIFTPNPKRLTAAQWPQELCEQINRDGQMLRGGVMQTNGQIKAEDKQNSLWIPQCSDLAVTLAPVTWWTQQTVTAENDLAEGESISTYVWDEYSNAELIKPHCFTPANESERKKENWVGAWAKSLNASALKPYVSMGTKSQRLGGIKSGEVTASIWEVGASLRVFTTEPSQGNWVEYKLAVVSQDQLKDNSVEFSLKNVTSNKTCFSTPSRPIDENITPKISWPEKFISEIKEHTKNLFPYIKFIQPQKVETNKTTAIKITLYLPIRADLAPETKITPTLSRRSAVAFEATPIWYSAHFYENLMFFAATLIVAKHFQLRAMRSGIDATNQSKYFIWRERESLEALPGGIRDAYIEAGKSGITKKLDVNKDVIPDGDYDAFLLVSPLSGNHIKFPPSEIELLTDVDVIGEKSLHDPLESFVIKHAKLLEDSLWEKLMSILKTLFVFSPLHSNWPSPLMNTESVLHGLYSRPVVRFGVEPSSYRSQIPEARIISGYRISTTFILDDSPSSLIVKVSARDFAAGVRLISGKYLPIFRAVECDLYYPEGLNKTKSVRLERGFCNMDNIWQRLDSTPLTPPFELEAYIPTSPLCEDYGNTFRSEVFDVSGLNSTGVDPRTGLFNAHYPLARLTGLDGKGPTCDLTLHYSPLRANESGLGDGWAFNFSWYDSRPRLLTLNNGQTIQFSETELASLKKGESVSQLGYSITATAATSSGELESIEILMPSGSRETLAKASGDSTEHNEEFVKTIIEKLKEARRKIPEFIASTHPLKNETWYQNAILIFMGCFPGMRELALKTEIEKQRVVANWEAYWEIRRPELLNRVKSEIDYWSRPELQYVPSKITSDFGGALIFNWKRERGQYLLETVKTTDGVLLLSAAYSPPAAPTETAGIQSTATFTIWPDTPDAYIVTLHLNNYLLKTIVRSNTVNNPAQTVQYGYSPDPTLDRVLTSILESDGSLEKVFYEAGGMRFPTIDGAEKFPLPRVTSHIISPGVNATPLRTDWQYSEHNYLGRGDENTAAYAFPRNAYYFGSQYRYWSSETAYLGNSIKRTWNALHLQTEEVETSPDGASKTTSWQYPDTGLRTDPAFGLPLAINTTYLDVSPATSEEAKS